MATNLRTTSTTKENIFDYIDAIKTSKSSAKQDVVLKRDFEIYFRNLLQKYNPDINEENVNETPRYSDKDLDCFIDAANTKHDVYSHNDYYLDLFSSMVFGASFGAGFAIITSNAWVNAIISCCKVDDNKLEVAIGGIVIGGVFGAYASFDGAYSYMEHEEFWHEALECYDDISLSNLPGISVEI